ncbi:MAG: glycosyl hydrolase family 17 protein [Candidatus Izemoplasmatales bacterium]|nr:glycosyl hydrolase family 17 protein [bacterium]MDZ4195734.1 glycosyl hydrolase family 17 protein [Candidatus Izemoplasmatales bacterium]
MSKPRKRIRYLGVDKETLNKQSSKHDSIKQLESQMANILQNKIHGLSFSPYLEGQNPDDLVQISDVQIASRLEIIRPYTSWIRTFSCSNGNETIPRIAHEKSLKTLVGVWIGTDKESNELEINNAIEIAKAGHIDLLAVGNEVLLREDMEVEELIAYIQRVKDALPHIQVGYVDAYYTFENYPEIVDVCDVVFANCYPFWEYTNIETAVSYMKEMYAFAKRAVGDKKVIISETGWPSKGEPYGDAAPSYENALTYFIQTQTWAIQEQVEIFYFSSFDEAWKQTVEGEYGAYWGIWDKDGNYKFNHSLEPNSSV